MTNPIYRETEKIKNIYNHQRNDIAARLSEFDEIWKTGDDETLFAELVFCLLTPQSKAKSCWAAVKRLEDKELLLKGNENEIARELNIVRFRNNKARYIVEARQNLLGNGASLKATLKRFSSSYRAREFLVENVKGLGYKEASHFLRNIGLGNNLAILDRHILKNIVHLGVIDELPRSLSPKKYLEIERKMAKFAEKVGIPTAHLDILLWCKETGEIFK